MNFMEFVQLYSDSLTLGQYGAVRSAAAKMDAYLDFNNMERMICKKNSTRIDTLVMKTLANSVSDITVTDAIISCVLFGLIVGALAGCYLATRKIARRCQRPTNGVQMQDDLPPPVVEQ